MGAVLTEAKACSECLRLSWSLRFLSAGSKIHADTIEDYLLARTSFKASFPGYPLEATPRAGSRFVEEFVLREGRRFLTSSLSEEELERVHDTIAELQEYYSDKNDGPPDRPQPVFARFRSRSSHPWAQFAWEHSVGQMSYCEGFALHPEATYPGRLEMKAWNILSEKVVDLTNGGPPLPGAVYFGVVLDAELREQLVTLRKRRTLTPDKARQTLLTGKKPIDTDRLPFVYGYPILKPFPGMPFAEILAESSPTRP